MSIDIKFLRKNKKFILFTIVAIIIFFIINILVTDVNISKIDEKDLPESSNVNYKKLVINEIMPSNKGAVLSPDGKKYDWIEIYNGNDYEVSLKGYGLSDQDNKTRWAFPDMTIEAKSYLIVYLSGDTKSGLYANFKINNDGGESIFFLNPSGKVVDAVDITATDSNQVMARDLDGEWFLTNKITPGYANTEDGYLKYQESIYEESEIKINEVLPKNDGNFKNSYDNYSGYIEIINTGKDTVNINNYCVSNNINVPFKYCLPQISLKSNEVYVIYMDEQESTDEELYSGFNLKSKNGVAVLTNNSGKIIDKVEYSNIANGIALVKEEGAFYETCNISPGYKNTTEGREKFNKNKLKNEKALIINEVLNNNSEYLPNNGSQYYDIIELKNNSDKVINLKDYKLTNSIDILNKYSLPDKELAPGEYYVLMASGDINLSNNSYIHINFKVSDIESLYLVKDKNIIDSMLVANVPLGYSIGRGSDYGIYYFKNPTLGDKNNSGVASVAYIPSLSKKSGVYDNIESINLEIEGNGIIYYTLDGSEPTTKSKVYNGPIFLNKTTVVRAVSYQDGKIISPETFGSYIINENHTLPVMSVSLNPSDFKKVQTDAWNTELEVSANAELYEDGKSFKIPCGFKLFGGSTRGLAKKSFTLKFRKKYGASSLNYQVFENRDYSSYENLILRSGSQDNQSAFIRDILMTSLVDGVTNLRVQAYKSVILYINGNYWGVYNIREKVDDEYISNNFNVDKTKSNIIRIDNNITTGSGQKYFDLLNYLNTHNLSKDEEYEYVKTQLNIDSYIDFWIAENWVTNNDIVNTRFYWHPDVDSGRINMIFYDLDFAMWNYNLNYYNFSVQPEGMSDLNVSTLMMRSLMKNKTFKQDFLNRVSYQYKEVWNEERVLKQIDDIYNSLKPEMERNQERWGMTLADWEKNIEELRKYTKLRGKYFKSTTKSFFNLNKSEMTKYFGD